MRTKEECWEIESKYFNNYIMAYNELYNHPCSIKNYHINNKPFDYYYNRYKSQFDNIKELFNILKSLEFKTDQLEKQLKYHEEFIFQNSRHFLSKDEQYDEQVRIDNINNEKLKPFIDSFFEIKKLVDNKIPFNRPELEKLQKDLSKLYNNYCKNIEGTYDTEYLHTDNFKQLNDDFCKFYGEIYNNPITYPFHLNDFNYTIDTYNQKLLGEQ